MNKEFVPYEQALALKELGFDEPCLGYWRNEDLPNTITIGRYTTKEDMEYEISGQDECHNFKNIIALAPTYSQCFRWFREKHNLLGGVYSNASGWAWEIHDNVGGTHRFASDYTGDCLESGMFTSFEKAELECIKYLIEIIKQKK